MIPLAAFPLPPFPRNGFQRKAPEKCLPPSLPRFMYVSGCPLVRECVGSVTSSALPSLPPLLFSVGRCRGAPGPAAPRPPPRQPPDVAGQHGIAAPARFRRVRQHILRGWEDAAVPGVNTRRERLIGSPLPACCGWLCMAGRSTVQMRTDTQGAHSPQDPSEGQVLQRAITALELAYKAVCSMRCMCA